MCGAKLVTVLLEVWLWKTLLKKIGEFGCQEFNEPHSMLAEYILKGIEELEWEKLLLSPDSVAYWAKRSKELREEHEAGKTVEWKPEESLEALFQ